MKNRVIHMIYGKGTIVDRTGDGRFVRVKFDEKLQAVITNASYGAKKTNCLSVGVVALREVAR